MTITRARRNWFGFSACIDGYRYSVNIGQEFIGGSFDCHAEKRCIDDNGRAYFKCVSNTYKFESEADRNNFMDSFSPSII
jgi:hypothetical protein